MKNLMLCAVAAAGIATTANAQDAVLGMWKTEVDDGAYAYIDVHMCGDLICGTIARTFNNSGEYQSENLGKDILRNMSPNGDGRYRGNVWRPSNDKIYVGKLVLRGDELDMKGCVAGGLICANQQWTRLP